MSERMHDTKQTADAGYYAARGGGRKCEGGCKGMAIKMRVTKIARKFSCGVLMI
jgi:hypothetical protein